MRRSWGQKSNVIIARLSRHSTTPTRPPTPTPTSSPTSSRGSSLECRRVVYLATYRNNFRKLRVRTCRRGSSRGCPCRCRYRRRGIPALSSAVPVWVCTSIRLFRFSSWREAAMNSTVQWAVSDQYTRVNITEHVDGKTHRIHQFQNVRPCLHAGMRHNHRPLAWRAGDAAGLTTITDVCLSLNSTVPWNLSLNTRLLSWGRRHRLRVMHRCERCYTDVAPVLCVCLCLCWPQRWTMQNSRTNRDLVSDVDSGGI